MAYAADQTADEVTELFSVPIDGSQAPIRLNGPLVGGGDVGLTSLSFEISPDGSHAIYVADQFTDEVRELFAVPIDGSRLPKRLNAPLVAGGDIAIPASPPFAITSDGGRVVYRADQEQDEVFELFQSSLSHPLRRSP